MGKQLYDFLMAGSMAYARWDLEVSRDIIRNRRKLLLIGLLLIPIIVVSLAEAAGVTNVAMLGGKSTYAPSFYSTEIFLVSIGIGLAAGLITGTIGAGGGFIITPALMAVGVKGIMAVGTDVFHIFAKAIMGTALHNRLGNVSVKLAIAFLIGSAAGTFIGGTINRALYDADPLLSEMFISVMYAVLLGFLGFYAGLEYWKAYKAGASNKEASSDPHCQTGEITFLQKINLPPMITFDRRMGAPKRISGVFVAIGGLIVGILAAILGVGGGFVTFPMFVYVFGVSGATTVGTDILQIIFTAGIASISQYAIHGYVFYTLAMGMLVGSLVGIQVGALTTTVVDCHQIRGFYAITIIAGFINRVTVLPKKFVELEYIDLPMALVSGIEFVGNILFWAIVAVFGFWVFAKFFGNMRALRWED